MPLRVLFLEDQPDDVNLLMHELRRAGYEPVGERVESEEEFRECLESSPDVVLSDFSLPGFNGLEGLRLVRESGMDLPFIFVSGTIGEEVAVQAMRQGADDYLLKDRLARLGPAVEQALARRWLRREKQQAEQTTARLAAIVESSSDAIIATTPEGIITSWNPGAEQLYGFTAAEILGKHVGVLIPSRRRRSDIPEDHEDMAHKTCTGAHVPAYETVRVRKDGRRVDVLVSISPVRSPHGEVLGASVIAHDISQRKRAERFLAAEHAVTRILAELSSLEEASPKLLQILAEALRWEVAVLWEVDQRANVLRRIHTWHSPWAEAGFVDGLDQQTVLGPGRGLAGRAWSSGEPIWESTTARYRSGAAMATEKGLRGAFGLPMRLGGQMVGVIEFYNPELRQPDETLMAALDNIAIQISQFSERRRSEAALRESEQRFRQFAESIREVFWVMDARNGSVLYVSPAYEEVWGRSRKSLYDAPYSYLEAVHPEDRVRVAAAFDPRQIKHDSEEEYRVVRPDGSVRWIWDRGYPVYDSQNRVVRFVGIAEDITDRKQAEEGLRRSEEQYRVLAESIPQLVWMARPDGTMEYFNHRWMEYTGLTLDELLSGTKHEVVHSQDLARMQEVWGRALQTGEPYEVEYRLRRADGEYRWYIGRAVPLRDEVGRMTRWFGTCTDIHGQRQAEEAVRASEARFRALVEKSYDGVVLLDAAGTILYASPSAGRIGGRSSEEYLGRKVYDWKHPDEVEAHAAGLQELVRHPGGSFTGESRFRHQDGSWRWVESTFTNLLADPALAAVVVNFRDVTDRKQAEAERDKLLVQLQLQIERMPLAYILFDADFRITDWNPAAERMLGYTREEAIGMEPNQLYPPSFQPEAKRLMARIWAGDMAAHSVNENLTKDGQTITCKWFNTPLLTENGQLRGLLCLGMDVTSRRQAEEALRLRDRAIQAVTQGILITDPNQGDNPIIYASPSFEQMTGYAAQEVIGRNCRFLQGKETDPDMVARLRRAIDAGQPCTLELLNYRKDGSSFWNELSISPVRDAEGKLTHFVGVQTDVTERRRLEEQYHQAQKMEAIGQLAGGVAHDFNNLLTIISGYSDLLLQKMPFGDPSRGLVEEIHRAGERSAALTRQLLAFSRKQVVAPRVLDLNAVVTDAEKMLRRMIGEDVTLALELSLHEVRVKADLGQLEQVLLNLAVNARDAMPQGGRLTIEVDAVALDERHGRAHAGVRPGNYALLAMTDTGSGMSPEVRARIFEPFFTTKEPGKGTGLGLAVVHGIVKQAGGHVEVSSTVGVGSTFKIYLPRVDEQARSGKSQSGLRPAPRGTETVLLVEDEDGVRALTRHVLQGSGYSVLEAADGDEALRSAERHHGPIHLIVTDVVMPGLGGRLLAERLLALHPELKVLYVSGYTEDAVVRHGVQEEQVHFLQKPFSPVALAFKVREVLDG